MRYSLTLNTILFLTIAVTIIVQARKLEYTCGNLGSGINPCRCNEVVVKAAKVQKPLFYASPEAINQAATAREVGRLSIGTGCDNVLSFPKYDGCTSGVYSISSSSSSDSATSAGKSSISSSASSIGNLEQSIDGSNSLHHSFHSLLDRLMSDSSCGCGKKSEFLKVHDLLSHNIQQGQVVPSFSPVGDLCYPSSHNEKYQITTKVTPAYPGKIKYSTPIPYQICLNILNGQIDEAGLRKFSQAIKHNDINTINKFRLDGLTNGIIPAGFGSYEDSSANSMGQLSSTTNNFETTYGTYGNSFATSNNIALIQGSTENYKSNCEIADFGDNPEFPEDYSYPRLPADPVSLSLAYKNLFPYTVTYNSKIFVPEDKLAFGHRTVPIESISSKKVLEVPEEKLQILDKPVVELKPIQAIPITFGIYNEHEEAKLAELEVIERERINQEEFAEQPQHIITYGDLGYIPINGVLPSESIRSETHHTVNAFNTENSEAGCSPLGSPIPDYVPGNVVIDRELVETESEDNIHNGNTETIYIHHYLNEASEEEDDIDSPISGIFARLKSVTQKHKPTYS